MKYVKMVGLAAVAAAALMAFVGASSASATVLCKTTPVESKCAAGWAYEKGTEIHAVNVGVVSLHSSFKTVECKKSTISGPTDNEGSASETVTGATKVLTFEECNCEVKVLKTGTNEVHALANHNGTLTANGQEVTVTCSTIFGNVHCIYITTNKDLGEITHSETVTDEGGKVTVLPAVFHANVSVERSPTNGLCAEESTWTATYEVTSPNPLYFANST